MGPRLFSRGNVFLAFGTTSSEVLQWGHDFSAVEIFTSLNKLHQAGGFNGATTFQPWKSHHSFQARLTRQMLQWGHDFSAVEIPLAASIVARYSPASMGPRLFSRGNQLSRPVISKKSMASMGPRLFSRGNGAGEAWGGNKGYCFNGATTFQPWK